MSSGTDVKPRLQTKKHRSKTFYVFISSFMVSLSLLLTLVFPIFSGKPGIEIIQGLLDDNNLEALGDETYLVDRNFTTNTYYNSSTSQYSQTGYLDYVNYQNETGVFHPINTSFQMLDSEHFTYQYGYRAYNNRGVFDVYLKPDISSNFPIVYAYNKGDTLNNTHVLRSGIVGIGYYDPSTNHEYIVLQTPFSSVGSIDNASASYSNIFSGTDLELSYHNSRFKEELVLSNVTKTLLQNNPPSSCGFSNANSYLVVATEIDYKNIYSFNGTVNISSNFTFNKDIIFKDKYGDVLFSFINAFAYEQNNVSNIENMIVRIIHKNNHTYLLTGIKVSILNSMTFPVVLDPSPDIESPGTVVDDDSFGTLPEWNNPDEAKVEDGTSSLNIVGTGISHYLKATNFGFSIGSTSTILGIVVGIKKQEGMATDNIYDERVRIVDENGAIGSTDKSSGTEWPTSLTYTNYGTGTTDLWGESWTYANINDADFGVVISADGGAAFAGAGIDHIKITVYYTEPDGDPPTPNPPTTWSTSPYETSSSSISMVMGTCSDTSTPVEYFIDETTGHSGATDKSWSTSTSHTDSGLSENTQYGYRMRARDSIPNTGDYSAINYDYTDINPPISTDFDLGGTITYNSIYMAISPLPPNYNTGSTGVYFDFVSGGTGGGDQAFSQTYTYTDSGLQENTLYTYRAKFRNGDGNDDGEYCDSESVYTYCQTPGDGDVTIDSYANTWIMVHVAQCLNPTSGSTDAYIDCISGGSADAGYDDTGWDTDHWCYNFTGLTKNTEYCFKAKYRNYDSVETTLNTNGQCQTTSNISYSPTVDYKYPTNGSSGIGICPKCKVYANDTDEDSLNVTWASNYSNGVDWVNYQTDDSVEAGTIPEYTFLGFENYSTTYWWKVYIDDGIYNISEIYTFTTEAFTGEYQVDIYVSSSDASVGANWDVDGKTWEQVRALETGNQTDTLVEGGCTLGTMEGSYSVGAETDSWVIIRYFCKINTSVIPENKTIDAVSFFLYDLGPGESTGNTSWSIQEGTQGDSVSNEDFDAFTGDEFAYYIGNRSAGYMELVFDSGAFSKINKDSATYFCIRQRAHDYLGTEPSGLNYFKYYGQGETFKRPYLCVEYSDDEAPLPNPLTWSVNPYALNSSSINMTSSTASDDTKPISYSFDFTSGGTGGTDSGWQISDTTYTDDGLQENEQYSYRCQCRDSALNVGGFSSTLSEYTYANPPTAGQLDVANFGDTWILWRLVDVDNNPDAGDTDGYFLIDTNPGGGSSGLSTSDDATYYYFNDTGLTGGQEYGMTARYDNYDGVDTAYCNEVLQTTSTVCISWYNVSDNINGSFTNATSFHNVSYAVNGSFSNTTSWFVVIDSVNGSFTNVSSWVVVDDAVNGTFSNSTSWSVVDSTVNGSFTNTTSWGVVIDSVNGTFINSTQWKIISDATNGSFINTTIWQLISDGVNGSFVNTSSWYVVDDTINGSFSNTSLPLTWYNISENINGSFTNITSWDLVNDSINGLFNNESSWKIVDDGINGSFVNLTSFSIVSESVNGSFSNTSLPLTWYNVSSDVNGSFVNSTSWYTVNDIVNGVFGNTTVMIIVDDLVNGSFVNSTSWVVVDDGVNGSFVNMSSWGTVDDTINGTFTNTTVIAWQVVDDTVNGSFSNTTTWIVVDDTINGSFSNTTSWVIVYDGINGSFTNTTVLLWYNVSDVVNGSFSNTTSWVVVDDGVNGIFVNVSAVWNNVDDNVNGVFVNVSGDIRITNEHPENNSNFRSLQPTVAFTLFNPIGNPMNYSIYIGNSSVNATVLLTSVDNVSDGTFMFDNYYTATEFDQYFWRVCVESGSQVMNETFSFNCSSSGGGGIVGGGGMGGAAAFTAAVGAIVGGLVIANRKRRRQY